MRHIRECEFDVLHFPGFEGDWFFEAFPKATAHDFAAHQHLITTHRVCRRQLAASCPGGFGFVIGEIVGEDVDQFYDEVPRRCY